MVAAAKVGEAAASAAMPATKMAATEVAPATEMAATMPAPAVSSTSAATAMPTAAAPGERRARQHDRNHSHGNSNS
jgi:hypothetical protein